MTGKCWEKGGRMAAWAPDLVVGPHQPPSPPQLPKTPIDGGKIR